MNTMKLKLMSAGVVVGCAIGLIAVRVAWATSGQGFSSTNIVGPVMLPEFDMKSDAVKMKSKGFTDLYITRITIAPGGHGGWHSHPGPSILTVTAGQATFYEADDPTTPHVYSTGAGFVEDGGHVHIVRNEGSTDLELVVLQLVASGAPRRIDDPQP